MWAVFMATGIVVVATIIGMVLGYVLESYIKSKGNV